MIKSPLKIILVEDDQITSKLISKTVVDAGFELLKVICHGEEAIEQIPLLKPDIVLMDIMLEGKMNGIDAARHLKFKYSVPIIYITAHSDPETVKKASDTEPYGYILKPINRQNLLIYIEIAVARFNLEKKIIISEKRLMRAQSVAHVGNWEFNLETKEMWGSEEAHKIYGIPIHPENLSLEKAQMIPLPEYREMLNQRLYALINSNTPYDVEFIIKRESDGELRHIKSRAELVYGDNSDPLIIAGTIHDITDIKEREELIKTQNIQLKSANEELRLAIDKIDTTTRELTVSQKRLNELNLSLYESEKRFREILENIQLVGVMLNLEANISFCNDYLLAISGWKREEIIWNNWFKIFLPPETRDEKQKFFIEDISNPEKSIRFENEIIMRDGSRKYISWNNIFLRDLQGRIAGVTCIGEDVTERKKSEEALKESEATLRNLINSNPESIALIDTEGKIIASNEIMAARNGKIINDMIGKNIFHMYEDDISANRRKKFDQVIESASTIRFEDSRGGKDFDITLSPIKDSSGKVTKISILGIDITERKKTEEQLLQSQKMEAIGRLAGGIAHDFNNMLTAIIGNAELLLLNISETDTSFNFAKNIFETSEKASQLTKQLLAMSRKQVVKPSVLNLNDILTGMKHIFDRITGEDIKFIIEQEERLNNIYADRSQIEQVILNLIVNARDAMPEGGIITIKTSNIDIDQNNCNNFNLVPYGNYSSISISDSGCGISPEDLEKIFDPFFTTKQSGTGLGLSIVYGIVKQSGGFIIVNSEINNGTKFTLLFHQYLKEKKSDEGIKYTSAEMPRGNEKILLIEDEPDIVKLVKRVLEDLGYKIDSFHDAESAINHIENNIIKYDLLLSDIVLPGIKGIELSKILKNKFHELKIILMSGYPDDQINKIDSDLTINYLQKPFSPTILSILIRKVLDENHD